jgi:hypothetical protein
VNQFKCFGLLFLVFLAGLGEFEGRVYYCDGTGDFYLFIYFGDLGFYY